MTVKHWMRGLSALAGAGIALALLVPSQVDGYTFLGGMLDLTQRDARVFDNFSDPESHNNTSPDPNFPGAVGAPLAIWKAIVEWGSELHGNGQGDPTQALGLGSGGANFDASWQGSAASVGGPDDNVFSEISGSLGGVFAFCEAPISDGWRIRFYADSAIWEDGPGNFGFLPGHRDIQAVATHEYGHALGLGHSTDVNATMYPIVDLTSTGGRSIEADDIAGVQALYGPRSAAKPHLSTYALAGGLMTISGAGFDPFANEVWFTDASAASDGTPLKVANLPSQNGGTEIVLAIPPFAGRGDLLVKNAGSANDSLSNAFPFDPNQAPCPDPLVFGTAKTTSIGTQPNLFVTGRPNVSTNDFSIRTNSGLPDAFGILLSGRGMAATPFMGGTLYIAEPYRRRGMFQFDFTGGAQIPVPVNAAMIGTTRYYQLWFHDPGDAFGVGLSNAVRVTFCP